MGVDSIEYVRENFEKKYAENIANGMYDDRDLERLRTDSTFVTSFIQNQDKLDDAVDLVHTSFKFRKEIGVNDLTESSFDRELLELGCAYFHSRDVQGHRILWLRVKVHRKDAPSEKLAAEKQGLIFAIDKAFNESPLDGIVVLLDMTSCGLVNLDMDFVKYIITIFKYYYPTFLAYMLIYDMPWIFNAAWKVIKAWLSPEAVAKIKFVSKGDVQTYIKAEDLPPHMGGTDDFEFVYTPGMLEEPLYPEDDTTKDKKVQFYQEDDDYPLSRFDSAADLSKFDINANQPDGLRQRAIAQSQFFKYGNLNNSAMDKKRSALQGRSQLPSNATTFVGSLLTVSPGDELIFQVRGAGDSYDVITLTNTLSYPVAFKVKTTSPEKFRVRPSAGIIKPDKSEEVYVYLVPDQADDVSKDKFLILATDAQEEGADPNQLFKDAAKDKMMQHKLKCSVAFQEGRDRNALSSLKAPADPFISKIEQLQQQNRYMQKQLNVLLVMQFLTVFTLLFVLLSYSCFGEDLFSHFLALPFEFCHDTCGRHC